MKLVLVALCLAFSSAAHSLELGPFNLDGHASGGYNNVQGTYGSLGADFYTFAAQNLAVGVGAYYSAGEHPSRDSEVGVGPFVSYAYPVLEFLTLGAREDLLYVSQKDPVLHSDGQYGSRSEYGTASITSLSVAFSLTRHAFLAVGYRFALGLNNSDLEHDRSGVFFGLGFGF